MSRSFALVPLALFLCTALLCPARTSANEQMNFEPAAEKLTAGTVTVRISTPREAVGEPSKSIDVSKSTAGVPAPKPIEEITVRSGVLLGDGLVATFFAAPADLLDAPPRVRVTLPGGEQANARIAVVDRVSQLTLLEIPNKHAAGLALAKETPKAGAWILTAAAAGVEAPAVSIGTLAARERSLSGVDLPPLLQCDLRTTETSSGAAVVDKDAALIGVLAAVELPTAQRNGLSYALGIRHIERLLKARQPEKTIELKRQRPMAGLTLGAGEAEGVVKVERVQPDGPAAKVDLRVGDVVIEADEIKIRSAYQAVDAILRKQPGDTVRLLVERGGQRREVTLELIGGGPAPTAVIVNNAYQVSPAVKATLKNGKVIVDGAETINRENSAPVAAVPGSTAHRSPGDEAEMLRLQLQGYERVIQGMQREIETLRADSKRMQTELDARSK
ncbi:MAG: S1C family serine protease [Pirellulales bacterium]